MVTDGQLPKAQPWEHLPPTQSLVPGARKCHKGPGDTLQHAVLQPHELEPCPSLCSNSPLVRH